jgi:hypothetical protein
MLLCVAAGQLQACQHSLLTKRRRTAATSVSVTLQRKGWRADSCGTHYVAKLRQHNETVEAHMKTSPLLVSGLAMAVAVGPVVLLITTLLMSGVLMVAVYEIALLLRRYLSRAADHARANATSQDRTKAEELLADWRVPIMTTAKPEQRCKVEGEGRLFPG